MDDDGLDSEARQHTEVARAEGRGGADDLVSRLNVAACVTDMFVDAEGSVDLHCRTTVVDNTPFDHTDGVGTGWHGGAGHDAHRLAGANGDPRFVSGHERAHHAQQHVTSGRVGGS
jgi:hypothetical protein